MMRFSRGRSRCLRLLCCAVIAGSVSLAQGTTQPAQMAKAQPDVTDRAASLTPQGVRELADKVDRHYNSLKTLDSDFIENYSGAGITRRESGTLWIKRPGHMRWDYKAPRQKLFVTDGKTAWFYVPGEQQARRAPVKSLDDLRSPLAYLLGKTKLEKEFSGLSLAPDVRPEIAGNVVLRGVPKYMGDQLAQVLFEITPEGRIDRIVAKGLDGSNTEFFLSNQKENTPIADARFRFSPPAGVETIESSDLGQ